MRQAQIIVLIGILSAALVGTQQAETGNTQSESVKVPASPCACESCECRDELKAEIEALKLRIHEFETSTNSVDPETPETTTVNGYQVERRGNHLYWQADGMNWNCPVVADGTTLRGGRWQYVDGLMIDSQNQFNGSQSGHWEMQERVVSCGPNGCRTVTERVWVDE